MEHLKNIAHGAFVAALIGGVLWLYVWLCMMYPLPMFYITATPFIVFAMWGLGRSLRHDPSDD